MMSRFFTRTNALLAAIVLVAAFFRLYRLDQIPPGFQFDQAFNAFDVIRLLQGQFAIFFPANTGREPLYFYLLMTGVALFGPTAFALKVTSAIIGLVTIPLVYGFARMFFRSVRVAVLAALFTAISLWHVFFSRYGLRVILEVPLTLLTFWFLWRAFERIQLRDFARAGFFVALALYTYPSARLLPFGLVILTGLTIWEDRSRTPDYLKGLTFALGVMLIVCLPLGIYFLIYPDQFISHTELISVFSPRVNEGNLAGAILKNLIALLQMFVIRGDMGALHNLPGRPVFEPPIGILFLMGVVVFLVALVSPTAERLNRRRAAFIATWLLVTLAASLFSDDAPNFLRLLPAVPAVMFLPAWGASDIWERLRAPMARRAVAGVFSVMVVASTALTFNDYFVAFANYPGLYYVFDEDKLEVSEWINRNASASQIFLAPLWYQQGTISLLTRNAPLKSFESRDTIVLPSSASGKDAIFSFPPEQEKKVQTMTARLGALGARDDLTGSNGARVLLVYRVPAKNLPDLQAPLPALARGGDFVSPQKTLRAVWGDSTPRSSGSQFELLGYSVDAVDSAKRNLEVTLFFHALKPMTEDYTFSVKVRDAKDRVWGQEDKWAGDNSYATTQWSVGDVIVEKFYPGLNACAPAGEYRISVEAYNPKTSQVLELTDREGNVVSLGTTWAEASPSNRLEDLEPEQALDAKIGERLQLIGYTLAPNETRAGDAFSLSLFWRGQSDGKASRRVLVRLHDASKRDFILAEQNIVLPVEGRGLCTLFDFNTPQDVATGTGTLFVNDAKIATIKITR